LFSSDATPGDLKPWRVIRDVTLALGERNVDRNIWRRVNSHLGDHIGYQILSSENSDKESPSRSSPTYISASEIMIYAGQAFKGGVSRTAGLTETERAERRGKFDKVMPLEDAVERIAAKVACWPFPASRIDNGKGDPVYGDKAVHVYPKA
jgi:hypothetical protein